MSTLERAIGMAAKAHEGQLDKGGHPYILHPLRVMMKMETEEERIVAVLHDVLEDTEVDLFDLEDAGFSLEIQTALVGLTRVKQTYSEFISIIKNNELATKVKIADIEDNMDLSRIPNPTEKDYDRIKKYDKALRELKLQLIKF